jgi:hypothetical protein
MNLEEFLRLALEPCGRSQRPGQAFMNSVFSLNQHLYRDLLSLGLDAFYDDSKMWAAVEWITRNAESYFPLQSSHQK